MKAIIKVTLNEALRKKTFFVMGGLTLLYLILWFAVLYNFRNTGRIQDLSASFQAMAAMMLTQTGLQFSSLLICLLTIMLGSGAVGTELENGMIHAILSRPIKRRDYILGRFIGLLLLIAGFSTILLMLFLVIGYGFRLEPILALTFRQLLTGAAFYLLVPVAVLLVTVSGSIYYKQVANGLLATFIYILGNIGGMVEMIGTYINNEGIISSGILLSLISPFQVIYSTAEKILVPAQGIGSEIMRVSGGLSGSGRGASSWMFLYIGLYCLLFMVISIRRFSTLDL